MKVLVGGGTGFVGRHLVRLLEAGGHNVTVISRTPGANRITWRDLGRQGLPAGCGAVVNLAGELLMNPLKRWNEDLKAEIRASRIDTTRQLASAISQAEEKPAVFVSSSAVGYYEPSDTAKYTEDSPCEGATYMSELCRDWEAAATLPEGAGVRQAVVRIGLVLGRDGGLVQNMYIPFLLGVGGRLGSGRQHMPWVHVDDVAGIIQHTIEGATVAGPLNAVAPEIISNSEFTAAFAKALWRPAIFPVPGFVLNTVFGGERASAMLSGQNVYPERTLEAGYKFKYPDITSAIAQCVKK